MLFKLKKSIKFYLLFFIIAFQLNATIDLEKNKAEFILETKRIILKDYKDAFNPSIIRFQDKLLMTFRIIPNPYFTFNSQIGIVILDDNFDPINTPQILDTQDKRSLVPSRAEDARLIAINNHLYMVYSDNKDDYITRAGFRVYVSELEFDGEFFHITHTDCLKDFENASPYLREKNWVPFDYYGTMLMAYSLTPHLIFRPIMGSETCTTVSTSKSEINWKYGELRGGTPAILDGNQYISFFHSSIDMLTDHSNKRCISHYFMGAYTFSSEPPFQITKISKEPIVGEGFYKGEYYKPYWKSVRCVFPCGLLVEDPYIYVSYGRQDHEIWIVKMDKQALLESLESVEQIE